MPLTPNSQDGAAQSLQGEGPLSERHREGHTGTVSGCLRAWKSQLQCPVMQLLRGVLSLFIKEYTAIV